MTNEKLISFELKADFGFFKKPDYNDGLLLSYNMLHKPALLGVLGAIIGLEGYKQKGQLPEYYEKLKHLQVSIEPLQHEKGNFQKTSVKYTNGVGYANADGNLLIEETMLVKPAFRCYLLLNMQSEPEQKLYDYVTQLKAEFIPYLGKNEFQAWIGDVEEWDHLPFNSSSDFSISSLFVKAGTIRGQVIDSNFGFLYDNMEDPGSFMYFERLPIGFDERIMQYQLNDFVFTDWKLKAGSRPDNLFELKGRSGSQDRVIQLF